jgi:hypothetical protein
MPAQASMGAPKRGIQASEEAFGEGWPTGLT